jgi:hypothetical protein
VNAIAETVWICLVIVVGIPAAAYVAADRGWFAWFWDSRALADLYAVLERALAAAGWPIRRLLDLIGRVLAPRDTAGD